jgi:hypothetical protein
MSRRQINSREYQNRREYQKPSKRSENIRRQRLLVILACEGEKTERYYFETLFEQLKVKQKLSTTSCVFAHHKHTNPKGVLDDLLNFKDSSTGLTYKDYDHRWIVIDRDEERCGRGGHTHEDFNNAISQAKKRRNQPEVKVAWSNPSFEIWYLLHFQYRDTPIDRDDVVTCLSQILGYSYKKNDPKMYTRLCPHLNDAIRNATRLLTNAADKMTPPAQTNPGTTVHELVTLLNDLQTQVEE